MKSLPVLVVTSCVLSLSTAAMATSPTCESAKVVASAPASAADVVPTNARLLFVTDGGCRGAIKGELRDARGALFSAVVSRSGSAGYVYEVRPAAALAPSTSYTLTVHEEDSLAGTIAISTGPSPYVAPERPPVTLEAVGMKWESAAGSDGEAVARIDFVARQPGAEAMGRYLLFDADIAETAIASELAAGRAELAFTHEVRAQPRQPRCFKLRYEDPVGALSEPSARTCIQAADDPPASAPPDGDSGAATSNSGGCSVAPALASGEASASRGSLLFGAIAALVFSRARGRRRAESCTDAGRSAR